MGEVFLARDTRLGRQVAIKRVSAASGPDAQRQILREARTVARLDHPNIAGVFDIVDQGGVVHIVMEYVEGHTLAARLCQGPLPETEAVDCGRQVADALAYAHGHGVVHCDIKPSNVIVTASGHAKVLDFGIARFEATTRADGTQTTGGAAIRGTPAYMAPEVLLGAEPTPRSDVYSLGVVLFELLTANRPREAANFAGDTALSPTPSPSVSEMAPGVSKALRQVVTCATAVDPKARFSSALELRAALDGVARHHTARRPWSLPFDLRLSSKRGAALIAILLAAVSAVLLIRMAGRDEGAPSTPRTAMLGVMVFNTTGEERNEYLSVGLTDVLVSYLGRAPDLAVTPRTALLPYLTEDDHVATAMRELGLTHVLMGGIQRSGSDLRLTLSILAGGQQTLLWSDAFDGALDEVFRLQQRVADAAMKALQAEGLVSAVVVAQARARPPTSNADAFDAYTHGRVLLERSDVAGNVDRAVELFQRAIDRDRTFVLAHAALGEAAWQKYRQSRDTSWIDRARASTLEALRLDPDDPSVRYSLAVIEHGTGRVNEAIAELQLVIQRQPARDDAHRLLGRIYSERGDLPRAVEEFREALRVRPAYPATIRDLGLAYYDHGKLPEAIAEFTRLAAMQPDNASAFQALGTAHHAAGELNRALAAYERANVLAPRATAYSNIGMIHHTSREYTRAIEAYRQAIALQPKEATTRRNLGDALWMAGDRSEARAEYEAAIDLAEQALKVNPSQARTRALVALCEAKLGRFDRARSSLNEALRLAPDDQEVVYKQAAIEALAGRRALALQALERALQLGYSRSLATNDRDLDTLGPLPAIAVPR